MPESPRPRIDPSIVAALIGLVGTVSVALISLYMNRAATPPATDIAPTSPSLAESVEGSAMELSISPADVQSTQPAVNMSDAILPTAKYPEGKRFKLFYDDNSFYLLNLSGATIPINRVAFERLTDQEVPLNRFNGTRWAQFYSSSTPGKCVALQILGSSPYLDPPECGNDRFLSLRTPTRDDPGIFWTAQEGSHEFRVLWREGGGEGEEIARCKIDAGICEIYLP